MNDITNSISDVWHCEQEILNVIHKICVENNLKYSLIFGTLLGAVRHGGFIPWDDDIDIIMPREDYEVLISIWNKAAPSGYLLQNKRTDPDFTQNFTKIRKDHTAFIQSEEEKLKNYHTGFFVDIFPADRVATEGFKRKIQYIASVVNLLLARGYTSGNNGLSGIIEKVILHLPVKTQLYLYNRTERYISKWKDSSGLEWYSPNTLNVCKRYFESDIFEDLTTIDFNGSQYYCVKDYDKLLKKIYGDYMKLPPEQERVWKHHPILIDFKYNYRDIPVENEVTK